VKKAGEGGCRGRKKKQSSKERGGSDGGGEKGGGGGGGKGEEKREGRMGRMEGRTRRGWRGAKGRRERGWEGSSENQSLPPIERKKRKGKSWDTPKTRREVQEGCGSRSLLEEERGDKKVRVEPSHHGTEGKKK